MVIALTQLCLFFFLNHNTKVHANANISINLYEEEYLLNTPGCAIPNIWREHQTVEATNCENTCGKRAVHIKKTSNNGNIIEFIIDEIYMEKFFGTNAYKCCYKFIHTIINDRLEYTKCHPFVKGTRRKLEYEVITVTCRPKMKATNKRYKDAFIILKKLQQIATNINDDSLNVLVLGMDTMSRGRAIQSMTELVVYFKQNNWLDYRAFQKAEKNTFPNVMNLLTCKKADTYNNECGNNMSTCNHLFIWSEFKKNGYVTAYVEDSLPDTFLPNGQFTVSPTDHYTRPLTLLGIVSHGNIACTRKKQTAIHVLDYAVQFVEAYKDTKFFGFFWLASNSHDPNNIPTLLQNYLIRFFEKLNNAGAMNNTVIIFIGDHGVRWGQMKIHVASYYDDRLPMLYMWFPYSFRERYEAEFIGLQLNQHRLTTHCDVHLTLWNILKLSDKSVEIMYPEACPKCSSLFEEKSMDISCEDINVSERWCSCHLLYEVYSTDVAATLVPNFLLSELNKIYPELQIKTILRHHWYRNDYHKDATYYVIVIQVVPSDVQYEAIIMKHKSEYSILEEIETISTYDSFYDTSLCEPAKVAAINPALNV